MICSNTLTGNLYILQTSEWLPGVAPDIVTVYQPGLAVTVAELAFAEVRPRSKGL